MQLGDLTPDQLRLFEIFHPYSYKRLESLQKKGTQLAHYTSADAGLSIIKSRSVWMRKSSCMSDYSEVHHGYHCLRHAWNGEAGRRLQTLIEGWFEGINKELVEHFDGWTPSFFADTYLTCVSEHNADEEDEHGRLSMWRAFGSSVRVAFIFNSKPFFGNSDALKIYSSPVAYMSAMKFEHEFGNLVDRISAEADFLRAQGRDVVKNYLFNAFLFAALCTKHPGFSEEREWRIIYSPKMNASDKMIADIQSMSGVPQPIYKIPLKDIPEVGFVGVEIPALLDRLIIGPTPYPAAVGEAFERALTEAGVENAGRKIFASGIPIRT